MKNLKYSKKYLEKTNQYIAISNFILMIFDLRNQKGSILKECIEFTETHFNEKIFCPN